MKLEYLTFAALAAALAGGSNSQPACGPGGCWMLPPDFGIAVVEREEGKAETKDWKPEAVDEFSPTRTPRAPLSAGSD